MTNQISLSGASDVRPKLSALIKDMFPYGVEFKKLGEVLDYEQPTPYLVNDTNYDDSYPTPVLTAGQSFILGYTDEQTGIYKASIENPTIIFDDFTTSFHWIDFDFKVKSSAMKMLRPKKGSDINFRFVYYAMQCIKFQATEHTRYWISKYSQFEIPIPPIEIQKKIVECLDKFSALAAELQAELQMRRKQYEYYRTQLLTPHSDCNSADKTDDCNWEWKTLLDVLEQPITDGPHETPKFKETGIPFISAEAIINGHIDFNRKRGFISVEYDNICRKKYTPRLNDIYLVKSGSTTGKVAIVRTEERFNIWSPLAAIRVNKENNPKFIYYMLQTDQVQEQVRLKSSQGSQPNLSMRVLEQFIIPVPSLAEQNRIVSILDKFEALTTSLSDGIPAEQAAQQKRYEYYRDLLLTFDRKAE